jgi:hypothetical protein
LGDMGNLDFWWEREMALIRLELTQNRLKRLDFPLPLPPVMPTFQRLWRVNSAWLKSSRVPRRRESFAKPNMGRECTTRPE